MYVMLFFGVLMALFSLYMIIKPNGWADNIIRFGKQRWFHWFEVFSRALLGALFLLSYEQTKLPGLAQFLGFLLCFVSVFLLMIGPKRHKAFAFWSAEKFRPTFRYAGIGSFIFGVFLIHSSGVI